VSFLNGERQASRAESWGRFVTVSLPTSGRRSEARVKFLSELSPS
jgi:hypothetical protein